MTRLSVEAKFRINKFGWELKMLKSIFMIVSLLFTTNVALANPVTESINLNVTSIDEILHIEKGFTATSTAWSPGGQHLLVTYSKWVPPSKNIVKHYLLDTSSHTYEEIDYGINESETNGILDAKWTPSGDKIYFGVSGFDPKNSGNCYVFCNPDGMSLRAIGTNYTNLSSVMENLGSIGFQRNLNWSPDSSKIVFEWQKTGNNSTGIYIADGNGTNTRELLLQASTKDPEPIWYDSDKIFTMTDQGTVVLINCSGDLIRTFQPANKDQIYCAFSLSPDKKKVMFASTSANTGLNTSFLHTCISNIDGSGLKGNVSHNENLWASESWQPNGSLLLVNQRGNLYIVEGEENNKHPLYKGNANNPQWFPDGKKLLFFNNKNKLYSIDASGNNLTFITNFGLTTSYFWDLFWSPLDKAKQLSVSPSGDIIAFTSAQYPDTGKIIENEPDPSTRQNVAAPLFIVNPDGSKLTQVTPTIKGKYDVFREWSPNGKQFIIESVKFSRTKSLDSGGISLVETDAQSSSPVWKNVPVKVLLKSKEPNNADKIQNKEPGSKNTSNAAEHKEKSKQFPYFTFLLSSNKTFGTL